MEAGPLTEVTQPVVVCVPAHTQALTSNALQWIQRSLLIEQPRWYAEEQKALGCRPVTTGSESAGQKLCV